jgi:glycosyltransferase involved in cell wall biosynthesis
MMRIKYIANVRVPTPRAQGYAIMKMCSEFRKAEAEVELFVPERKSGEFQGDPFQYYKLENNFEIKKIRSSDFLGKTLKFGKLFYWADVLSFFISLRSSLVIGENEILYTRDYLTLLFFSKHTFTALELHDIPTSKFLFKIAIKKAKFIFVLNNNLKQDLVALGVSENKIFIYPSGVEISDFNIDIKKEEARKKLGLPQDKNIAMYTGHLYKWKGADTLALAATSMPETLFVFVGGVEPELSKFVDKYKKYQNIITRPFAERSLIPTYLKSADVLVLPNSGSEVISARYTSPLKLFEYMASRRPIVASDLPSIKEVLTEKECLFATPDDPASFASAIKTILNNPELAETISQNAYVKVGQYSWTDRAKNILEIIKNVGLVI